MCRFWRLLGKIAEWEEWIREVIDETVRFRSLWTTQTIFRVLADKTDILILEDLEKDATISFKKLGEILGIFTQLIWYHYRQHILRNNLIEQFKVSFPHFGINGILGKYE